MDGAQILVASMSVPRPRGPSQTLWQYHSRSDLHSKVACWGALFDLLASSRLLHGHVTGGQVVLGINFTMRDFSTGRKKKLDLVVARPTSSGSTKKPRSLAGLASEWGIVLTSTQQHALIGLPPLHEGPVGAVLMALEAKAAMTAHNKAEPRLYDELNSSHLTVHGASRQALAVGLVMANMAPTFISPDLNPNGPTASHAVVSRHAQPAAAEGIIDKVREIPRRRGTQTEGYDGLGLVVVDCVNDNTTPISLVTTPPAPQPGDVLHYDTMITRVANEYDTTFVNV